MQVDNYIALSSQMALRSRLDVLANNLANASTPGFKSMHMVFSEYLSKQPSGPSLSYVRDAGTYRDTSQGPLSSTGNPLDLALQGDGYFEVQTPQGIRYTRNGQLQLDQAGNVVTSQGYPVLNDGAAPLNLPPGATAITVNPDGTVSSSQGSAGHIAVVTFADPGQLVLEGAGLYSSQAQPVPATSTTVAQGMVEGSNVQPVIELTQLMRLSDQFTLNMTMLNDESSREKAAISQLGQVP